MKIENMGEHEDLATHLRGLDENELMAQELVQQGATHAISFLLEHGCTEATARGMLVSLRANAEAVRAEAQRRGKPLFGADQLASGNPTPDGGAS